MSIIEQDDKRYIEVETTPAPPHPEQMFEMMKVLGIPVPTLANIDLEKGTVSPPAGISFVHEAWVLGCKAWHMHTSEGECLESGIDAAVASCLDSEGQLNYYLWCVWADMMGFELKHGSPSEQRDHFLAKKARAIATYAVEMLQADAEGAA